MESNDGMKNYVSRWKEVEAVEREELRQATFEQRWRQLKALTNLAWGLGLKVERSEEEEMAVILRWAKIKDFYAKS